MSDTYSGNASHAQICGCPLRTGGELIVDSLIANGVDRIFCVPGESYLDVLDALYSRPEIDLIVCRHEGAASNMAEADGKLTRRPGICFVTRGPGATHASVGVHIAYQDSTPLILFIGQVDRGSKGRDAFQEIDYNSMFGSMSKLVLEINDVARIPECIARAFRIAVSGRPGPVVIAVPEDMLREKTDVQVVKANKEHSPAVDSSEAVIIGDLIDNARKPLAIVGGGSWHASAQVDLQRFVEALGLPVSTAFRRQDAFDNLHPNYIGHLGFGINPSLAKYVQDADLLLVLGAKLDEPTTASYSLISVPRPSQSLIHVHPDPDEIGRCFQPEYSIAIRPETLGAALAKLPNKGARPWQADMQFAHQSYLDFSDFNNSASPIKGVNLAKIVGLLGKDTERGTIITNGAGNYTIWLHRFYRFRMPGSQLAPTNGAMGYGLPAAIAAKLRYPAREVICFAGDGCFLMYPQEIGTAVQNGAAVIVIIVNNGRYGTIRMHQERRFPNRVIATDIETPDFQMLGKSLGAYCEQVGATEDFEGALDRARRADKPAIIELLVDPDLLTPDMRISPV